MSYVVSFVAGFVSRESSIASERKIFAYVLKKHYLCTVFQEWRTIERTRNNTEKHGNLLPSVKICENPCRINNPREVECDSHVQWVATRIPDRAQKFRNYENNNWFFGHRPNVCSHHGVEEWRHVPFYLQKGTCHNPERKKNNKEKRAKKENIKRKPCLAMPKVMSSQGRGKAIWQGRRGFLLD